MAKSIPTLYREWQARQKEAFAAGERWRKALAKGADVPADVEAKRAAERAQDAAARKLANACFDSRGRWRWDGENPPVDLLKGKRQR